jgi:hypothetical protein
MVNPISGQWPLIFLSSRAMEKEIMFQKLGEYIVVPPSIRHQIESEMEDIVNNANDDLKNCPHRRRFTSNSERRHISIMPNTTLASIRDETRPLRIIIK